MKKLAKRSKALTLIPVDTSSPNSHQIRAAKAAAPVIIKTSYSRKIENATHPPAKELNLADLVGFSAKFEDDPQSLKFRWTISWMSKTTYLPKTKVLERPTSSELDRYACVPHNHSIILAVANWIVNSASR